MLQYIKNLFGWGKTAEAVVEKEVHADHAFPPGVMISSEPAPTSRHTYVPPPRPEPEPKVVRGVLSESARASLQKRTPEQKREQYRQAYTPPRHNSAPALSVGHSSDDYYRRSDSSSIDLTSTFITGMMVNEMLHSHHTSAPDPAPGYAYGTSASTDYSTPSYSSSSCTSDDSSRSSYSSSDYSSSSSYDSSSSSSYDSGSSCSSDW